ncbi:hypothetical protein SBRY_80168 [Actinacidiphila bryophytorum]|uniref:Uncharacterized protein n=1 Tax=Actinacidiphila bryophytorum TaxID=1436133 RepID=A0A9W4H7X0_9ACTN|nr:hypothetical protein SBRY_80168 [Actinacidiphila bryophytorum]
MGGDRGRLHQGRHGAAGAQPRRGAGVLRRARPAGAGRGGGAPLESRTGERAEPDLGRGRVAVRGRRPQAVAVHAAGSVPAAAALSGRQRYFWQ